MIKGKADIYLYDGETGDMKQHVTEDNMVTNAVQNILTGSLEKLVDSMRNTDAPNNTKNCNLNRIYTVQRSIAEDLFGGIMLFSKKLKEDVEHCIPSKDELVSLVGFGSNIDSELVGSKMKGTYNKEESSFSGNTAKLVFDFGNGIATGDIASIALTSALGGKYAPFCDVAPADKQLPVQIVGLDNENIFAQNSVAEFEDTYGFLSRVIGSPMYIDGGTAYVVKSSNLTKYNIGDITKRGIGLLSSFSMCSKERLAANSETVVLKNSYTKPMGTGDLSAIYAYDSKSTAESLILNKLYGTGIEEQITVPCTELVNSIRTYLGVSSITRNVFYNIAVDSLVYNNKIYFIVGDVNNASQETRPTKARVYELDFSGNVRYNDLSSEVISLIFGTVAVGSNTGVISMYTTFSLVCGLPIVGSTKGKTGNSLYLNTDTCTIEPRLTFYAKDVLTNPYSYNATLWTPIKSMKEPWICCVDPMKSRKGSYLVQLYMCYLATINNLKTPVTKGETDKLKIVYTLTEETI